ncbi:MAG TPA: RNA 2',3'-cyclic phosphodiesterase [Candidatus Dormibacteraeota bacterium]
MSPPASLFLAIEIPGPARLALAGRLQALSELGEGVRPVRQDGLHLTVRFLGRDEPGSDSSVSEVAAQVALETPPFPVRLGGLGLFKGGGRMQVLWVGVEEGAPGLRALARALSNGLAARGWEAEQRPLRPHCTVARLSGDLSDGARAGLERLLDQARTEPRLDFLVERLALFESLTATLGPNRYRVRSNWALAGV